MSTEAPEPAPRAPIVRYPEEMVAYALAIIVGAIPIVGAIARHAAWQWEAVLGLAMVLAGATGACATVIGGLRRRRDARRR